MAKTNVGVDMALVNLKNGGTALVPRGAELPSGLADGEDRRLTDLGVFTVRQPTQPVSATADPVIDSRVVQLETELAEQVARADAAEKALAEAAATVKQQGAPQL